MGELFEKRDLAGSAFRDVNLHQAVFNDVNLEGASIVNANLKDLSIDDAYIQGMTIFGIRVDLLIAAELDRRDPERVRLRMSDSNEPGVVRAVMKRLNAVRSGFCDMLRSTEAGLLTTRPSPDQWSVIEIVRHLVFAEELYLNRWILGNDEPWSRLGLLPAFLARDPTYAEVGSEPTHDLESVLDAWEAIHRRMQAYIAGVTAGQLQRDTSELDFGQGTVGHILQGLAQHDLMHIRQAEGVIAKLREAPT
jgi:hypothetical protein